MDPKATTTKTTAKDRATSTPRVQKPAGTTPPAKAIERAPAAKPSRRLFLPGQCHFRDEAGRAVCKEPRPADKPSHLLCDRHEALWHAGKLRLSAAGKVRLFARVEAAKLDPKLAKKVAPPKPVAKARTRPAHVATIPPQNIAPKLPEPTVKVVEAKA